MRQTSQSSRAIQDLAVEAAVGSGILAIGAVAARGGNLLLQLVLARGLKPANYGEYAIAVGVFALAFPVVTLGLGRAVLKFCADYFGTSRMFALRGTWLRAVMTSTLLASCGAVLLGAASHWLAVSVFHAPALALALRWLAWTMPGMAVTGVCSSVLLAVRKPARQQILQILPLPITVVVVGILVLANASFRAVLVGLVGASCAIALVSIGVAAKSLPQGVGEHERGAPVGALFRYGFPLVLAGMSYTAAFRLDRVIIGTFCPPEQVAEYAVAASLALQLQILHSSLVGMTMPIFASLHARNDARGVAAMFHVAKRWTGLATAIVAIPLLLLSHELLGLFGPSYANHERLLAILVAAIAVGGLTGPTGGLLQMTGRQWFEFANGAVWLSVLTGLCWLLVPKYGIGGGAVALLLGYLMFQVLQVIELWLVSNIQVLDRPHVKLLALAATFLGVAAAIPQSFPLWTRSSVASVEVFLVCAFAWKSRTPEDLAVLARIRARVLKLTARP